MAVGTAENVLSSRYRYLSPPSPCCDKFGIRNKVLTKDSSALVSGMHTRGAKWLCIFLILNSLFSLQCYRKITGANKTKSNVRAWGQRQLYPSSKIPANALSTKRSVVRRKLVLYHNFFRSKVRPTASNMLLMSWHEGAARQAQGIAERCTFLKHNSPSENTVPHLGICGQNLFASAQKSPWFFVVKSWFLEYQNFSLGNPHIDFHKVGHYTQMVWATTHKIGCGMTLCPGGPWGQFYNYVCHYCPGGNIKGIVHHPYKLGPPCGDCPDHCIARKLCTNTCPKRDHYSNCDELHKHPGVCQQGYCNATCSCKDDKLYKNYPFP